jgi:uncharacterized protein (DUF2249 family)/TusA-related sulfurtransferase
MISTPNDIPVNAGDIVSDVLARDESLVEVFVRHAPHFAKLRNRAMRRVMARLVTVAQAARTAGVPVESLLRDLNDALGIATPGPTSITAGNTQPAASDEARHPAKSRVVELDVREDLRSGREPFSRIMAAVSGLADGDVLRLRAIFEPAPLFSVLGKRGFLHESQAHSPDDWSVWFWRSGRPAAAVVDSASEQTAPSDVPPDDATTTYLDVRGLGPPEPMMRTLAALETLPKDHTLVQINSRVPQFLFPALIERGFACQVDDSRADRVLVRIWHARQQHFYPSHQRFPNMTSKTIELDVRVIPPRDKHPTIFRTFESLASGDALVIINDHDPRPLRYQFAAEHTDQFDWTYEAEGPDVWRVRIGRR